MEIHQEKRWEGTANSNSLSLATTNSMIEVRKKDIIQIQISKLSQIAYKLNTT